MSDVNINLNGLEYTFPSQKIDDLYDWVENNGGEPIPIEHVKPDIDHDSHVIDIIKTLPDEATIGELLDIMVKNEHEKMDKMVETRPVVKKETNNLPTRYERGGEL